MSLARVLVLSAVAVASPAMAAVPIATPGYSFTGGFATAGSTSTFGYWFYVRPGENNITVTELGYVDVDSDGLFAPHVVAFWDDAGNLLAAPTVPAGTDAPLIGGFRYVPITPVKLVAEARYWVGAQSIDETYINGVSPTSAAPFIPVDAGYTHFKNGADLTFPRTNNPTGGSAAIVNFQYIVPEPASLTLLAMGAAALLRRQR